MNEIIRQLLTGRDNQTHDIGRWLAALFAGVGAMLKLKEGTEP